MEHAKDRGPLGRLILEARKLRGYSQSKLAKLTGLGVGAVGAYEQGKCKPKTENLAHLCVALGLEPEAVCREALRAEAADLTDLVQRLRAEKGVNLQANDQKPVAEQQRQTWDLACGIWKDKIVVTARLARTGTAGDVADGMVRLVRKLLCNFPLSSDSITPHS